MTGNPSGMGVDSSGGPVIDPTRNVLDKVEDSVKRLDDLRVASERLSNVKYAHLKEIGEIRAAHAKDLAAAETDRINAIRAVDVGAVAIAAERTVQAATVLANQVAATAETLRTLVASSSSAMSDRIAQLERTSYEGSGKSAVADPQLVALTATVETLVRNMNKGAGQQESRVERRADYGLYIAIVVAVLASGLLPRLLG